MQKNRRNTYRTDLRQPLIACAIIGLAAAVLVLGLAFLLPEEDLLLYGGAAVGLYVLVVGIVVWAYLARYRRITLANDAAKLMTTEIHDMFRYVMDIPYAIIHESGTVKIVSGALQDLLKLRSPLCNVPVGSFCSVPMEDIIACAKNGGPVRKITVTEDGVPVDHTQPMRTEIDGKKYDMQCYPMRSRGKEYYFVVFRDVTEVLAMRKDAYENEPVVAYIVIDSLQELAQYIRVSYRTAVSEIEAKLKEWAAGFGGMIREYEREKYVLVFTREALDKCIKNKFRILDTIRSIKLGDNSFPVTISIGVGAVHGSFEDKERAASDALDIALQKGGDQAAVNDGKSVTPYGGRVNTMYGSTTITSRVNSEHLCRLMREAGNVLIMGHRSPDYDSIGSCVGLARLAICARGDVSKIRVVVNREHANFRTCYDLLAHLPEYRSMFISADTAMDAVRSDTLLIMSDVNNVYNTESPKLLKAVKNIVIIDHHRRQDELYEFKPLMTYIRPAVAAAGELVSEMLEHSPHREALLKEEANLLLAGIMLDTKNFTVGAGMQTFSAVHYLYGRGAHANAIRTLFTESMSTLFTACDIDSRTRTYRDKIALTWLSVDHAATEEDNIAVAKAADKLMTIDGIEASFALLRADNTVTISARSRDRINVQIIMQRLGGGGHYDMAGTRLTHTSLEAACVQLKTVLDDYLDNEYENELGMKR
ncbi:MAG: DHH family phosphoesterase [Clostridia bacterium]|nr:DHH family phosphoesterase [Clostridia bacterium]MBQ5834412.1 DHH family phosphoesterase [Clostridia bacterium]